MKLGFFNFPYKIDDLHYLCAPVVEIGMFQEILSLNCYREIAKTWKTPGCTMPKEVWCPQESLRITETVHKDYQRSYLESRS